MKTSTTARAASRASAARTAPEKAFLAAMTSACNTFLATIRALQTNVATTPAPRRPVAAAGKSKTRSAGA